MKVLLHVDEIFLKGKNQNLFIRHLINNIQALFPSVVARRTESVSFVLENVAEKDLQRLTYLPGIANFSPVLVGDNDLETIKKMIDNLEFSSEIKKFRISAVRSDKKYKLNSKELEILLGNYVGKKFGWQVDLKNFDTEITVEIGLNEARVYNKVIAGAGGLPTGVSGKVLCLLSGGIDSPVAAYFLMKRGAEVNLVHFQNETKVNQEVSEKIIDLAKVLTRYQPKINLFIVPFAKYQHQVIMKIPAQYRMIVSRRLMFSLAEKIAKKEKCLALATGDSLGQVASQTLENLTVVYNSVRMLKLTPLIGVNKSEIMHLARKIGTLDISNRPYEDCCSLFVAKHPETRGQISDIKKLEKDLVLPALDKKEIMSYHIGIS